MRQRLLLSTALLAAPFFVPQTAEDTGLLPLAPLKTITFNTREGTWMGVDVSPDGRTLAFDMLGQVFLLPIRGGTAQQLTEGPAWSEWPQFADDGRSIVFTSDRGGYNQLWKIPVNGKGQALLLPDSDTARYARAPEISAEWHVLPDSWGGPSRNPKGLHRAPGSRYDIWKSTTDERLLLRACSEEHFILKDNTTGEERRLASAGSDCGPSVMPRSSFTPDGTAFVTSYGGKIWRIAVPSGDRTEIPFQATVRMRVRPLQRYPTPISEDSLVHARRITSPAVSPDGARLAFSAFSRIWVMDLPKGKPRRLTSLSDAGEFNPVWSPDGRDIAFVTWTDERGGEGAIYRTRANGSTTSERVTHEPGYYTGIAYSLDGTRIFAKMRGTRAVRRLMGRYDNAMDDVKDEEIVSVPSSGGFPTTLDVDNGWPSYGTALRGRMSPLRVRKTQEERIERLFARTPPTDKTPLGATELIGAVLSVPARRKAAQSIRATPDTVLRLTMPRLLDAPWQYGPTDWTVNDIAVSPNGDRAIVSLNMHNIYLIEVPPAKHGKPPTLVLDPDSPYVRVITPMENGGEFPQWNSDGKSFVYSHGSTVFLYDVAIAETMRLPPDTIGSRRPRGSSHGSPRTMYRPTAITIDLTAPRDLPRGFLALRNARIITMRDDEVIERGDIVIRDRRIVAIGRSGSVSIPSNAHVVDVSGKTIMPGMVDLHNHIFPMEEIGRSRVWPFEANLTYGVFASRDVQADFTAFMSYEDLVATGQVLGPRYMNTGTGIGFKSYDLIASFEDARRVVARYADVYKVHNLKEYMIARREARQWLVMAAAERKMNVTSHGNMSLRQLLQNAVDGFNGYDHTFLTIPLYADVRQLLAQTGITLAHSNWVSWRGNEPFESYFAARFEDADWKRLQYVWTPNSFVAIQADELRTGSTDRTKYPHWKVDSALAAVVRDGGRVAVGSHGDIPGIGTHLQMWAFVEGGMPKLDALRSATLRGAQALGMDKDLGSLEIGKLGDLVILDANPLDDIMNSRRIRWIVFNGRLREAETLDQLWPVEEKVSRMWWNTGPMPQ
jgi:Tol biopolymer transport system component